MAFKSKYTGAEVDALLDKIAEDNVGDIDSALSTESENPVMNKVVTEELSALETKVDDGIESLQTEVDSHDVAIEDLQDNKVDKGDYAPALTAGFADNLVSKDVVVDSEFNLRRSGGGAISDGVARIESIKGNSVVWNQWFAPRNYTVGGIATTYQDGKYHSVGQTTGSFFSINIFEANELNHKYLFVVNGLSSSFNGRFALLNRSGSREINNGFAYIFWNNSDPSQGTHIGFDKLTAGTDIDETYTLVQFDLTQMFGAGNEPTTIEEFYARKPIVEDEYAYNEGEVIHCNVDAVKSVGRNLFDEDMMTDWEGVTKTDEGWTGNVRYFLYHNFWENKIGYNGRVALVGKVSCENISMNARIDVYYTDGTGEQVFLMKSETTIEGNYLTASNKVVDRIAVNYGATGQFSIYYLMIALATDGDTVEGFTYEPYKEDVRELPSAIKEVFPNGMMSAGTAHDVAYNDLNKEVGVTEKRIGVVDLGTLNWNQIITGANILTWYATVMSDMLTNQSSALKANILCDRYTTETWSDLYYGKVAEGIAQESTYLRLVSPELTTKEDVQSALQGVMLYYELAEPIVTEHQEPFNLDYQVTNGGQEQAMATEPTSAFKAEIAYGFNATAKIKENANEIAQLKATIAQLQAALASMVNENVEEVE